MKIVQIFPELKKTPFTITSSPTPSYNCIAWAAGRDDQFWWPGAFWPKGVPKKVTRKAFVTAFEKIGYEVCDDHDEEEGFEKVALYEKDGAPTHAARQLGGGQWTSKLGKAHDISHTLDGLNGDQYGMPVLFMRRQKQT